MKLEEIIAEINSYSPQEVTFIEVKGKYVICRVWLPAAIAAGVAICSTRDKFDSNYGKIKAAGRALKALVNKESSEPVRKLVEDFPKSWTVHQVLRVTQSPLAYKSMYTDRTKLDENPLQGRQMTLKAPC